MATFKVSLKKVNKKGEAPIYISFYINREKVEVPAKISIDPKYFDVEKGIIKLSYEGAKDHNLIISNIRATITDIFVRYRLRKEDLTPTLFWEEYKNPGIYKKFYEFCTSYQQLRFNEIKESTQKKHITCLNNLKSFKENLLFADMTTDFFRKFVLYLRRRKLKEVTINKHISVFRIYINDAIEKGLLKKDPTKGVKLRGHIESTVEALDEKELSILVDVFYNRNLPDKQKKVLEFFLFLCFSSLHVSDAKALTIEQIGDNDFWYIRGKMLNVRPRIVRVPISDPLRRIIAHQKRGRTTGVLWENITADQKINEILKSVATIAGLKKNLSTKIGRHTFATIYYQRTRDLNTLKEIMGHSNIKQTTIYAHVLNDDRKEGIQVFNSFMV